MESLERILEGENPRNVFLTEEDGVSIKTRFPLKVNEPDISKLTDDQLKQLRDNSKKAFKWMQEFIKGSGLEACGINLETPKDRLYMEITPEAVAFTPNLRNYIISDYADDKILGLIIFNWENIKNKIRKAAEWLLRNKKETEDPGSLSSKISNFSV